MSPDHPQRRPKRTRKIVGKPPVMPDDEPMTITLNGVTMTGSNGYEWTTALDDRPRWTRFRSWLADRCAALARWLRP